MCAKVQGPFMSLDASGTLAGAVTASKWKGRNYLRVRVTPANPQSPGQTGVRANFAGITALWKANTVALMSAFATLASQRRISEFNAFMAFNQKRLSAGQYPADTATPTEAAPAANATGLSGATADKYASLTWTDSVSADAWAYAIYRKLGSDPTGLRNELIAMVPVGLEQLLDGPLPAGAYHYVIAAVSNHGGRHAVSASVTVTIV